jgi:BppU N-terminal domain
MQTINHPKGDSLLKKIIMKANDTAVNLTGYTFFFTVKKSYDDDVADNKAVVKKSWTTHADATNGLTLLEATATEMDIPVGQYLADIQYKDASGNVKTLLVFMLNITPNVTNRTT